MKLDSYLPNKLKLYNTMSRRVEEFAPLHPPRVGFYACGPTVYDYTHLGHLRRYTMDDVLIRTLRAFNYQVKFVQNITDVGHLASDADTGEDKLEKGAKKYQQSVWEIAQKFEQYFFASLDQLNVLRPDISCRATEYINEQIEMVQELEHKGYTYVIEGDGVYFDTSKLDDYGRLARLDIKNLQAGARVEMVPGKRQPTDFALWKFERQGENRQMSWPSPWSKRGFPGWHIECSAMSRKHLGDQYEIHTGGMDHVSVHHPNEIAQTESVTGQKPSVKYWVHHGVMTIDGQKMSKSLGNIFTIDDVKAKNIHPLALRLFFLSAHYRGELNFTWENLAGIDKAYRKLVEQVRSWQKNAAQNKVEVNIRTDQKKLSIANSKLIASDKREIATNVNFSQLFWSHLFNDLDTPQALSVFWQVVKSDLSDKEKLKLILDYDRALGLGLDQVKAQDQEQNIGRRPVPISALPENIQELLRQRAAARVARDFATADQLRLQIETHGYQLVDQEDEQLLLDKNEYELVC